jgi:hypothetical protein
MKKQLKPIPKFANEDEERQFWEEHDSSEYRIRPSRSSCPG